MALSMSRFGPATTTNQWAPWQLAAGFGGGNGAIANPAAYGSVPGPVKPQPTAGAAVPLAMQLGQSVFSQLPGYQSSLNNVGANIGSETAGVLPQDVLTQIEQTGAERGVSTGSPGSPNANAAMLRALGLTSLDLTNMGQRNLQGILPTLPGAGLYENPSLYPSSGLDYQAGVTNAEEAAAPNPYAAAMANLAALSGATGGGGGRASGLPGRTESGNPLGGADELLGYSGSPYTSYGGNYLLNPPGGAGEGAAGPGEGGWVDNGDGTWTSPDGSTVDADGNLVFDAPAGGGGSSEGGGNAPLPAQTPS